MFIDFTKENKNKYTVKRPGKYLFFLFNKSGCLNINIASRGAEVYILGVFVGKKDDNFNIQTNQHHSKENSSSDLLIKGVFFDKAKFIYQGTIKIEKGAQKSHAYQKNQNLIMSDGCFVDSRPFLEILANDVFCTHGSTTGKLNEEQLYYLKTRGIKDNKAKGLLIDGFLNDAFLMAEKLGFLKEMQGYRKQASLLLQKEI